MTFLCGLGGWFSRCWRHDEGEEAMPEFGTSRRPPKAPLSHISEERSSQMAISSRGNDSRDQIRRSMSNADTYSSNGTRRSSADVRNSHSFEGARQQAHQDNLDQRHGFLEPYVDNDDEGSQTSNLTPLPTQNQMTARTGARRRSSFTMGGPTPPVVDAETPRSNRSSCTLEQMTARSESDEIDQDEYSLERMSKYLNAQMVASPPPPRGKAPDAPAVDISRSEVRF